MNAPKGADVPQSIQDAVENLLEAQFELGRLAERHGAYAITIQMANDAAGALIRLFTTIRAALASQGAPAPAVHSVGADGTTYSAGEMYRLHEYGIQPQGTPAAEQPTDTQDSGEKPDSDSAHPVGAPATPLPLDSGSAAPSATAFGSCFDDGCNGCERCIDPE